MHPPKDKDKPKSGELVEVWDYVLKQFDHSKPHRIRAVLNKDSRDHYMVELESGWIVSVEHTRYSNSHQPPWREVKASG